MSKTTIQIIDTEDILKDIPSYGNFILACQEMKLPYRKLNLLKFPIVHENYIIHKKEHKTGDRRKK